MSFGKFNFCAKQPRSVAWVAIVGGSLALLIWAKLRFVATVPRTAYADPSEQTHPTQPQQAPKDAIGHQ